MIVTKTIKITAKEIIKDYICKTEGLTTFEYLKKYGLDEWDKRLHWNIVESGDHDKGTYNQYLASLEITLEE